MQPVFAQAPRIESRFEVIHPLPGPPEPLPRQAKRIPTSHLLTAGVLGAVGGFVGGLFAGAALFSDLCNDRNRDDPDACEWSALGGGIIGAAVGESIVTPVAIHATNRGRGNLLLELLISGGLGALGVAAVTSGDNGMIVGLVGVPIAQIALTIQQERHAENRSR